MQDLVQVVSSFSTQVYIIHVHVGHLAETLQADTLSAIKLFARAWRLPAFHTRHRRHRGGSTKIGASDHRGDVLANSLQSRVEL